MNDALPAGFGEALADDNTARARQARKRTRIQETNEARILDAGLDAFSTFGFRGATLDQIAAGAGMSKTNLLYYFRRKQDIYAAVLRRTLAMWLAPLIELDPEGEPEHELRAYVARKLALARSHPRDSRLYAGEMLQGAPMLQEVLESDLRQVVEAKTAILKRWMDEGRMRRVAPNHLIFMIWATTQHYADFAAQVNAVCGSADPFEEAEETISAVLLHGVLPEAC